MKRDSRVKYVEPHVEHPVESPRRCYQSTAWRSSSRYTRERRPRPKRSTSFRCHCFFISCCWPIFVPPILGFDIAVHVIVVTIAACLPDYRGVLTMVTVENNLHNQLRGGSVPLFRTIINSTSIYMVTP